MNEEIDIARVLREQTVRENPPLWSGEVFRAFLLTAREDIGDEDILDCLEAAGGGRHSSLDAYLQTLDHNLKTGGELIMGCVSRLAGRGVRLERMIHNYGLKRLAPRTYYYFMLSFLAHFSRQPLSVKSLDLVTSLYNSRTAVEWLILNCMLTETHLESRQGSERKLYSYFVWLDPSIICLASFTLMREAVTIFPALYREKPARVRPLLREDCRVEDPYLPGQTLSVNLRPSLAGIAQKHGVELGRDGERLTLSGRAFAEPDRHPHRVFNQGLYRITHDVKIDGGRVRVEKPASPFRPRAELALPMGLRYHLDIPLPYHEFEVSYRVSLPVHIGVGLALLGLRRGWEFLGGGKGSNPWDDLKNQIDVPLPSGPSLTPRAGGEDTAASRLEQARDRFNLSFRETQVLEKIAQGKSNREIAGELLIEEATVKSHVARLFHKTGFKNRHQVMAYFYFHQE